MTFYAVEYYEDGYRRCQHVSSRESAAEVANGVRRYGAHSVEVTKVKLTSTRKRDLLAALNCAANGYSFEDVAEVETLNL